MIRKCRLAAAPVQRRRAGCGWCSVCPLETFVARLLSTIVCILQSWHTDWQRIDLPGSAVTPSDFLCWDLFICLILFTFWSLVKTTRFYFAARTHWEARVELSTVDRRYLTMLALNTFWWLESKSRYSNHHNISNSWFMPNPNQAP